MLMNTSKLQKRANIRFPEVLKGVKKLFQSFEIKVIDNYFNYNSETNNHYF